MFTTTILTAIVMAVHTLPPDVLNTLGVVSDIVSDFSPAIIRPIEHVVFTILLN